METMLRLSERIDRALEVIARTSGWVYFALIGVIIWDILTRKIGFQLPGFGSTPIQELEWHLHGSLFMFWLGYAYVRNVHVRIDVFTAGLDQRRQAWLELIGIAIFAVPYCLVATWYAYGFTELSYMQNEQSDAPNGLSHRWIIKSFLFLALVLLCASVISVFCRKIAYLFGPPGTAARAAPAASGR